MASPLNDGVKWICKNQQMMVVAVTFWLTWNYHVPKTCGKHYSYQYAVCTKYAAYFIDAEKLGKDEEIVQDLEIQKAYTNNSDSKV